MTRGAATFLLVGCLLACAALSHAKDRRGVPQGHAEDIYCSACKRLVKHLADERDHFLKTAAVVRGNDSQKRAKIYNKKQLNTEQIEVIAHLEDKVESCCDSHDIYKDKALKRSCTRLLEDHDEAAVEHLHKNLEDDFCENIRACSVDTPEYLTKEEKEDLKREEYDLKRAELADGWLSDDDHDVVTEIDGDSFHKEVMSGPLDTFVFFYRADVEGKYKEHRDAIWKGFIELAGMHKRYMERDNETETVVAFKVFETTLHKLSYDLGVEDFASPVIAFFPEKRRSDPVVLEYNEAQDGGAVAVGLLDALAANTSKEGAKKEAETIRHEFLGKSKEEL